MDKSAKRPSAGSSESERFLHVLESLYGGNQRPMAEFLGMSRQVVSNIARGVNAPGRQILERLAEHPAINPAWLLDGQGEPFCIPNQRVPLEYLPATSELHEGLPQESPTYDGAVFPAAVAWYRVRRYWLRIAKPIMGEEPYRFHLPRRYGAGDMVLVDADIEHLDRDALRTGRCVVAKVDVGRNAGPILVLGMLDNSQAGLAVKVEFREPSRTEQTFPIETSDLVAIAVLRVAFDS